MTKEKSCGALVYRKNKGRVDFLLLVHRLGGHWSFPKGHVEKGETEKETALREVKEETGLSIRLLPGFRQKVSYSPRPGVDKDVVYFLGYAEDSRTVMQEEEVSELRWIDIAECHKYLTYKNDRVLLSSAKRYLRRNGIFPIPTPRAVPKE
ncbi:MAG: bis(5'-nucleosyl)-tetraphosphatase [Oscillospiraceae bacterium]